MADTSAVERWSVVTVSYPFVEGLEGKVRPVLIVSTSALAESHEVVFAMPITTARNMTDRWPDDVAITNHADVGLPTPCVIRPSRLATLRVNQIRRQLGTVNPRDRRAVTGLLRRWLA